MLGRRTLLASFAAVLMAGATATAAMAEKVVIGHFGTPIPLQAAMAAGADILVIGRAITGAADPAAAAQKILDGLRHG